MPTNGQSLTTVKMDLDHFTGTVKFQAAENLRISLVLMLPVVHNFIMKLLHSILMW
jgi:hypothetical protein